VGTVCRLTWSGIGGSRCVAAGTEPLLDVWARWTARARGPRPRYSPCLARPSFSTRASGSTEPLLAVSASVERLEVVLLHELSDVPAEVRPLHIGGAEVQARPDARPSSPVARSDPLRSSAARPPMKAITLPRATRTSRSRRSARCLRHRLRKEITLAEQEMPLRKSVEPFFPISRSNPVRGPRPRVQHRCGSPGSGRHRPS